MSGLPPRLFDPALGAVDPLLGWGRIADGGVDRYEMAGEHVSMLLEPYVEQLAEILKGCLEQFQN